MRRDIAELFELDPALTHLNHGAFGAVPRSVREAQDRARARIEGAPMRACALSNTQSATALPLRPGRVLPRMIPIFNSLTAVLSGNGFT